MDSTSWKEELAEMARADRTAGQVSLPVAWDRLLPTKFSDLLECIELAIRTPDVWDTVTDLASRPPVDPGVRGPDDPEVETVFHAVGLIGSFVSWYRRKKNLNDDRTAYSRIPGVLESIARGDLRQDDLHGIGVALGHTAIVDSINDSSGNIK